MDRDAKLFLMGAFTGVGLGMATAILSMFMMMVARQPTY